jgi:hypothetical protein
MGGGDVATAKSCDGTEVARFRALYSLAVRAGAAPCSRQLEIIQRGVVLQALEEQKLLSGVRRIRCDRGWVSFATADGRTLLGPVGEAVGAASATATTAEEAVPPEETTGHTPAVAAEDVPAATPSAVRAEGGESIGLDPARAAAGGEGKGQDGEGRRRLCHDRTGDDSAGSAAGQRCPASPAPTRPACWPPKGSAAARVRAWCPSRCRGTAPGPLARLSHLYFAYRLLGGMRGVGAACGGVQAARWQTRVRFALDARVYGKGDAGARGDVPGVGGHAAA